MPGALSDGMLHKHNLSQLENDLEIGTRQQKGKTRRICFSGSTTDYDDDDDDKDDKDDKDDDDDDDDDDDVDNNDIRTTTSRQRELDS